MSIPGPHSRPNEPETLEVGPLESVAETALQVLVMSNRVRVPRICAADLLFRSLCLFRWEKRELERGGWERRRGSKGKAGTLSTLGIIRMCCFVTDQISTTEDFGHPAFTVASRAGSRVRQSRAASCYGMCLSAWRMRACWKDLLVWIYHKCSLKSQFRALV